MPMENENPVTAEENPAVIEDEPAQEEFTADALYNTITQEAAEEPESEEPAQEEEQEEELTPEQKRTAEVTAGLQSMIDEGWTKDEMAAFCADAAVKKDIADGKSVEQATIAYLRRAMHAQTAKPAAKKSVPTFRNAATAGAK